MGFYSLFPLGKRGHKVTIVCPLKKCNYTSRVMIATEMDNKISNHSKTCPTHRLQLISQHEKK